mmetsp:Transcript_5309/g.18757  ORF Transcript_5309/g.18757 Transcript_5309/m.18757 type:complete len:217 (+) Transcript_5309:167-817(+)
MIPCQTHSHVLCLLSNVDVVALVSTSAFQSILFSSSFEYLLMALGTPSATTRTMSLVIRQTPVRRFSRALTSTLNLCCGLSSLRIRKTATCVSLGTSESNIFFNFFSRFSAGVSCLARFLSSWALCLSSICFRTSFSMAVGSMEASSPRTLMRLLILTFGLGGSSNPCAISACFSFSLACLLCVLSFFISFLVNLSGCGGGGGASAGGSMGTGCST